VTTASTCSISTLRTLRSCCNSVTAYFLCSMTSPRSIFTAPESFKTTSTQKSLATSHRLSTTDDIETTGDVPSSSCNSAQVISVPTSEPVIWNRNPAIDLQRANPSPTSNPTAPNPKKRTFSPENCSITPSVGTPFAKRLRIRSFPKHTVSSVDFQLQLSSPNKPTSPLFFSNSIARPQLPARFSSGEAGARMLSQAHAEENKVKTVSLARASYSGQSPPGSIGLPSHRSSLERSNTSIAGTLSPEEHRNEASRILSDVGVVELLEQDFRPTLIIDLSDGSNYAPGPLRLIFANSSLRSNLAMFDFVQGRGTDASPRSEPLKGFPHFKAWLLSATLNGESLDVCLPSFVNGGVSWSVSTIRKRLRVASASPASSSSHSTASPGMSGGSSLPIRSSGPLTGGSSSSPSLHRVEEEPQDYFGDAVPSPIERGAIPNDRNVVASIETPSTMPSRMISREEQQLDSSTHQSILSAAAAGNVDYIMSPQQDLGFFDWTRMPFTESLPRHIQFARSVDWASGPLGPIEFWSPDLRQMCNLIMASPHPAGKSLFSLKMSPSLIGPSNVLGR
jgi:hypothetical protein